MLVSLCPKVAAVELSDCTSSVKLKPLTGTTEILVEANTASANGLAGCNSMHFLNSQVTCSHQKTGAYV